MAAVLSITDSISAPPSSSLLLPPSASSQPALSLPPTGQTSAAVQSTSVPAAAQDTASDTASATSPLPGSTTTQPLAVVLDALATAGVDTAINQEILAPTIGQTTGTFSIFIEQLFTALAAQSAAAEQNAQSAAVQQSTPAASQSPASTGSALNAFATTSPSSAPNSALENDVQNLAQSVNAQATNPTLTAESSSAITPALSPLQQSFEQFLADAGGTPSSTSLGGFLQALATNLHTVQSPLGNIVNLQT